MTGRYVSAFVLVQMTNPTPGQHTATAEAVAKVPGVRTATGTIGAYDTIATLSPDTPDRIAKTVGRIQRLDVVDRTLTLASDT